VNGQARHERIHGRLLIRLSAIHTGWPIEEADHPHIRHASPHMTAHYARIHDTTIREAFDHYQSQRVNIAGQALGYDPDAPTATAEWVKHNLSRIRDSLPNGYCGRPPQQDCPHPNACGTQSWSFVLAA